MIDVQVCSSVKKIDEEAFYCCLQLERVTVRYDLDLSRGPEEIGFAAFGECTSLRDVELPMGLMKIGGNAFLECRSLFALIIPPEVKDIGEKAFYGCLCLTNVELP